MSHVTQPTEFIYKGKKYQSNYLHRTNHNKHKSQWTITEQQEFENVFKITVDENWFVKQDNNKIYGYGIFLPQDKKYELKKVGETESLENHKHITELFLVKFVLTEERIDLWHGFPCGDKDTDFLAIDKFKSILEIWREKDILSKKNFSRIFCATVKK